MTFENTSPSFVALGGGHGLSVTLQALTHITPHVTAVVGVSDNGGSSGRLRSEFDVIPPGDLRMALTALCGEDDWGQLWAKALQHRFEGDGPLSGHAVGNLLIAALWQQTNDVVAGLDAVSHLLGARGRVLPLALEPLDIVAEVEFADGALRPVFGQVEVAQTPGKVLNIQLLPTNPNVCQQSLDSVKSADVLIMGPGSWFTSVLTHVLVDEMAQALITSPARKVLICNLCPQRGETEGFSPAHHLDVLREQCSDLKFEVVIADEALLDDDLITAATALGARVYACDLTRSGDPFRHDADKLASAITAALQLQTTQTERIA